MADLASILKDPNYVNANDATKAAIFDKWAPQDPNFANANTATQDAIRAKFGVSAKPVGKALTGVEAIPGNEKTFTPEKEREAPLSEKLLAPVETGVGLLTGAITSPIVAASKIYGTLTSGKYGTQEGIRAGEKTGEKVQQFFAPALSPTAQKQTQAIANALSSTGLEGVPMNVLSDLSRSVPAATRAVSDAARAPVAARAARIQEANVANSYRNAARIDATKDAIDLGIAVNPAESNPTVGTRLKSSLVGTSRLDTNLSHKNLPRYTDISKEEIGVPANQKLDAAAFEQSRARPEISGPYDEIRGIKRLVPVNDSTDMTGKVTKKGTMSQLDDLTMTAIPGEADVAEAANKFLDNVKTDLSGGISGSRLLTAVRQYRNDAQAIFDRQAKGVTPPSPEEIAKANMRMGIANVLEGMVEDNITDRTLLGNFRKAREEMKKTYVVERATNLATGEVDPQVYAKLASEGAPLTGRLAQMGNVAANFPEVSKGGVPKTPTWQEKLTRSSPGGTAGAILGSPFGLAGSIVGGAAGAAVSNAAGAVAARRMATPAYQAAHAMPQDFRPPVNKLTPANINYGGNQLVPYETPVEVLMPGEYFPPNFGPGSVRFGVEPAPFAQRGLPNEIPRQTYEAQKRAELAQGFRETAERKPARGGSIIDIDPVTGKMTIGAEALGGMTPNTQVISSTGAALQSAAEKATAGKLFDFTAAEKVAWDKTRADLAEVSKGFEKLDDKAVAAKMMDRKWTEDALTKAREKAQMFDDLAKRMESEQARRDAAIKRDQMLDLMQTLEDNLQAPRPTSRGGQGPKTRNFLAQQNKNALRGQ